VFAALDLGYVDRILFTVQDDHPSSPTARALENYSFKVSYTQGKAGKTPRLNMSINPGNSTDLNRIPGTFCVARQEEANSRAHRALVAPSTSTTHATNTVSREEVNRMMQHMIKQLVVLTSALHALPKDRWLSMSLVYNSRAPKEYAPEGFCVADAQALPRFAGEVLNVNVGKWVVHSRLTLPKTHTRARAGEVHTDEHAIAIKLQQPDLAPLAGGQSHTQKLTPGDDEDDTAAGWADKKADLLAEAKRIVGKAGPTTDVLQVLKASPLAKQLSPDLLTEMAQQLSLNPKPSSSSQASFRSQEETALTNKRSIARCKRPLHQVVVSSEEVPSKKQQPAGVVATYSKRGRAVGE
jgi:hypothetical protein